MSHQGFSIGLKCLQIAWSLGSLDYACFIGMLGNSAQIRNLDTFSQGSSPMVA